MEEIKSILPVKMTRALKYSGVRVEQYEELKSVKKYIDKATYDKRVNTLNKKQVVADKAYDVRAAAERKRIDDMIREAKLKRRTDTPTNEIVYSDDIIIADVRTTTIAPANPDELFEKKPRDYISETLGEGIVKSFTKNKIKKGDTLFIRIFQDDVNVASKVITINDKSYEKMFYSLAYEPHNFFVWYTLQNFEGNILQHAYYSADELEEGLPIRVLITKPAKIIGKRLKQKYSASDSKFCVLEPLIMKFEKYYRDCETQSSKQRIKRSLKSLQSMMTKYPNGVPEESMEEVGCAVSRCLVILDIIGSEYQKFNKKSPKKFFFTNTRRDHVEAGYITLNEKYESVTLTQLIDIMEQHDRDDKFYYFEGDVKTGKPRGIKSLSGCWAVFNEDHDIYKDFSDSHNIKDFALDAIAYPQVNEFIYEGRLINSVPTPLCDQPNDIDDCHHIDVVKAYIQHLKAPYFMGFPGSITHYGKIDHIPVNAIGFFEVNVVEVCKLLSMLGLIVGNKYILTVPEIKYFTDLGCEFTVLVGAFGFHSFNITYTEEMLQKKRYAMWAGKLSSGDSENRYTFKGDALWASHLKYQLGDNNVLFFSEQQMIIVKIPKKTYKTTHHILGYITAYTRLNMIEIMSKISCENLVKVVLDGIYFRGEIPDVQVPYKDDKKKIRHIGFRDAWYYPTTVDTSNWININQDFIPKDSNVIVLTGAGGTGKSHSVLSNSCIISPLYVTPMHTLGQKMSQQYKKKYTTINKIAGIECQTYKETKGTPGCLFIDELTMINKSWIDKVIKLYPTALLLLAGDVDGDMWFQTRNGNGSNFNPVWTPGTKYKTVHYSTDFRAQDQQLKDLKTAIRAEMKRVFTNGELRDSNVIKKWLFDNYKTVSGAEALALHKDGDIWIAGTHDTNKKLLTRGIVSGFKNTNGSIDFEKGDEKRGSFTIHSFQGLTFSSGKIFICPDVFEYAMTYTAISRAVSMDQIVIIRD